MTIQVSSFKIKTIFSYLIALSMFGSLVIAQETPPAPAAPRPVNIPAVRERTLPNGLTVAVVERQKVPLVTVQVLIKAGAGSEAEAKAGLANLTASLLTKGTKTRTATQIAEEIEFLGGSINSGAGWNNSVVTVSVMSDKLDQALTVLSDVVLNPTFQQEEIDLLKSQTLDNLAYNLKQPGFLANYVASKYSFNEHPAGGTPESINSITRQDITDYHQKNYLPNEAVLIFSGNIPAAKANALAQKFFGGWKSRPKSSRSQSKETRELSGPDRSDEAVTSASSRGEPQIAKRILVVDLPNSGQAAVSFTRKTRVGRNGSSTDYYQAMVLNSVLGGGYSSRLNQEIRIKRGLSYGAGSSFVWRQNASNFAARAQTKNESAPEVAELLIKEVQRLRAEKVAESELLPRKLVLTGDFSRDLETTAGLTERISELYSFGISPKELNAYMKRVNNIEPGELISFSAQLMNEGDIVIAGDYSIFKDELARRFPNAKIEVVKAEELDLGKTNLKK